MRTKIRPADMPDAIRALQGNVDDVSVRVTEYRNDSLAGYNELKRNAEERRRFQQAEIDANSKSICNVYNDLYKTNDRLARLEQEVARLKRNQFSFTTYFTRIWAALRNKQ